MIKLIIEAVEKLTNNISLISATEEDLDLIIEAELFTTKASYTDGKIPKDVKDEIIQDAKDSIEHTRMITYNDEIIGILQAYELEGYWYIGEIYLIEEYRGQGIGRNVLEYEINNHKDMTICLNVYKNNTHAIELYKSLGFEVTEDSDGRYIMKLFPVDTENYGGCCNYMKLCIKESNYITEAIDDIKKYYPRIPDDVFMQLIQLDPTYRGNDSAGKYGKWLLNLYNKGNLSEEEFSEVTPLLNQFTTYRNRIQNKDLNSYKSLSALADVLADVVDDDSMLTNRQKVRFLKNVKSGKVKTFAENDYDVVLETPNFIVYVPNTHEASMKLGKGTRWCTAHENPEWYNRYTQDNGKLYIIKNKWTGERWQYSDLTNDFLDVCDDKFNIPGLMKQDEKLSKFFEKFLGVDYYNFDDTLVYDGGEIPDKSKSQITKIRIDNSVTKIEDCAFLGCTNLTSIKIPNSVTEIERGAFLGCTSLTAINIPDSVTKIGNEAFQFCKSLTSIKIPNSVTKMGNRVFSGCTNLTSVNIPNSVIEIGNWVFNDCDNLTVYTNNNYVKEYCNDNNIPTKPLNSNESVYKHKQYKLHIKETYELKESTRPNVFDNNSRETYGDLINPNSKVGNVTTHDYYKFEKGEDARLTYMTADEYINRCINDIFKSNYDKVVTHAIHWDKVDKYAELMKQGVKFPTPYLNYKNKGQEGRHRALAFAKAFGDDAEMPVIEIFPTEVTNDEIFNYCQERWGDGKQWFSYVAYKLGRTEKEVCDYLGIPYNKPVEDDEDEDDTELDFDISDEDVLDDEYEMDEFEEFVREQSGGKIQNVFSLPADEFMKWMTKFTKYNS